MADKTAQTIYIDADPGTVMDVIADIGTYPEWVKEYKDTEVLEADDQGYPRTARLVLDAAVLKAPYDAAQLAAVVAGTRPTGPL